jgi:hypothetical protein
MARGAGASQDELQIAQAVLRVQPTVTWPVAGPSKQQQPEDGFARGEDSIERLTQQKRCDASAPRVAGATPPAEPGTHAAAACPLPTLRFAFVTDKTMAVADSLSHIIGESTAAQATASTVPTHELAHAGDQASLPAAMPAAPQADLEGVGSVGDAVHDDAHSVPPSIASGAQEQARSEAEPPVDLWPPRFVLPGQAHIPGIASRNASITPGVPQWRPPAHVAQQNNAANGTALREGQLPVWPPAPQASSIAQGAVQAPALTGLQPVTCPQATHLAHPHLSSGNAVTAVNGFPDALQARAGAPASGPSVHAIGLDYTRHSPEQHHLDVHDAPVRLDRQAYMERRSNPNRAQEGWGAEHKDLARTDHCNGPLQNMPPPPDMLDRRKRDEHTGMGDDLFDHHAPDHKRHRTEGGAGRRGGRGGGRGRVCAFWGSTGCFKGHQCAFLHEGPGSVRGRGPGRTGRPRRGRG